MDTEEGRVALDGEGGEGFAGGGKVVLAPMVAGLSTTKLIEKIVGAYGAG